MVMVLVMGDEDEPPPLGCSVARTSVGSRLRLLGCSTMRQTTSMM